MQGHKSTRACLSLLITAINPRGCQWYAPLTAIYYINMLRLYMHVYYLPKSLLCSSNLDLYHKLENKKETRRMCSVITWPVGGNTCILSGWVSAKELLLQCQEQEGKHTLCITNNINYWKQVLTLEWYDIYKNFPYTKYIHYTVCRNTTVLFPLKKDSGVLLKVLGNWILILEVAWH